MGPSNLVPVLTAVLLQSGKLGISSGLLIASMSNLGSRKLSGTLTNIFPLKMLVVLHPGQNTELSEKEPLPELIMLQKYPRQR